MSPILVVDKKESKKYQDSCSRFVSTRPHDSANSRSGGDEDRLIQQALAGLQLPHSNQPKKISPVPNPSTGTQQQQVASIRVMVVADLDLASASALAEYSLQQKKYQMFDASLIDLCIACGPLCRDEDLSTYLTGRQQQICASRRLRRLPPPQLPFAAAASAESSTNSSPSSFWSKTPFFRSHEETAALEGLVTAALSQLENIVCRVLYCPGNSDPLSTLATPKNQRLTPNSRNVHQQWMPLAPGLGCAGLFYLNGAEEMLGSTCSSSDTAGTAENRRKSQESSAKTYDEIDPEEETDEDEDDGTQFLVEQLQSLRQTDHYTPTLTRLLQLAPLNRSCAPPRGAPPPLPFATPEAQSVLLTHHVDVSSLTGQDDQLSSSKESASLASLVNNISDLPTNDTVSAPDVCYSKPMPWQSDHEDFLAKNRELLCMEIASGAPWHPAKWIPSSSSSGDVLLPGSLRKRGEFSVVELGLLQQGRVHAWKVKNVDIHNVHAFPLQS